MVNDFELENSKSCALSYFKRNIVDNAYCAIVQTQMFHSSCYGWRFKLFVYRNFSRHFLGQFIDVYFFVII